MVRSRQVENRPTMQMVAAQAGVSKITVSRALRGSELVRPELRERIVRIASETGYRMNVAARSLRTRRTQTIAVVIEQLARDDRPVAEPLLLTMIGGLLEVLTPADHAMLLTTSEHFFESNAIGADAIIALGQGEGGRCLARLKGSGLPIVAWGEPVPGLDVPVIGSDNRLGGRLAAEHLITANRRKILFVGDPGHPEVAARLQGVRDALAQTPSALAGVIPCTFSTEGGRKAIKSALGDATEFDAVIAVSDFIAAGACDALASDGVAVPRDVAIVGFDDTPIASAHRPSITSVRQDVAAAGRALGEAVLARLDGSEPALANRSLPVTLVPRQSST